jgi:hypothetical protein
VADPVKFSPRLASRLDEAALKAEDLEHLLRGAHELVEKHTEAPEGTDPGIVAGYLRDAMGGVSERQRPKLTPNDRIVYAERLKRILDEGVVAPRMMGNALRVLVDDLEAGR